MQNRKEVEKNLYFTT